MMLARDVSVRELRNHTAHVVRRVEAGDHLTLTVNGRPVADIVPHDPRPRWTPGEVIRDIATNHPADRGLLHELKEMLGQTIDEL